MAERAALEFEGVSKRYPSGFALREASFSLPEGYVMGMVGRNGAGKTSLVRIAMGLARADSGRARLLGVDSREARARAEVGFVYDENCYPESLSPLEIGLMLRLAYPNWDKARYCALLAEYELPARRPIKELSRGMKTKLALACALARRPRLLIMDEPTSGLDPVFRAGIIDALRQEMAAEGLSILFSTHITQDLERFADMLCFIDSGRIIFCEEYEEAMARYAVAKGPLSILCPALREKLIGIKEGPYGFEALVGDKEGLAREAPRGLALEAARVDDIMLHTAISAEEGGAR
jgi:ABC-2 type transport system ATP-binding protein